MLKVEIMPEAILYLDLVSIDRFPKKGSNALDIAMVIASGIWKGDGDKEFSRGNRLYWTHG